MVLGKWRRQTGSQGCHKPSVCKMCSIWMRVESGVPVPLKPGLLACFYGVGVNLLNILKLKMFELFEKKNEIFLSGSYRTSTVSSMRRAVSELSAAGPQRASVVGVSGCECGC